MHENQTHRKTCLTPSMNTNCLHKEPLINSQAPCSVLARSLGLEHSRLASVMTLFFSWSVVCAYSLLNSHDSHLHRQKSQVARNLPRALYSYVRRSANQKINDKKTSKKTFSGHRKKTINRHEILCAPSIMYHMNVCSCGVYRTFFPPHAAYAIVQ